MLTFGGKGSGFITREFLVYCLLEQFWESRPAFVIRLGILGCLRV